MSSVIAVSVSLIGLLGVVFTLAIFLQMILSFPAMLSNNSQTYVQQQRKLYHIGADQREMVPPPLRWDEPLDDDNDDDELLEDRWIDVAEDDGTHDPISDVESMSMSIPRRIEKATTAGTRWGLEPMTRGRSLRRSRRRYSARTVMRVQDVRRSHYDVDLYDTADCNSERMVHTSSPAGMASGKQDCVVGWRTMEWTR